jgi:hypothetical protein
MDYLNINSLTCTFLWWTSNSPSQYNPVIGSWKANVTRSIPREDIQQRSLKVRSFHEATYTFSRTIPLAWDAPAKGLAFQRVPKWAFL